MLDSISDQKISTATRCIHGWNLQCCKIKIKATSSSYFWRVEKGFWFVKYCCASHGSEACSEYLHGSVKRFEMSVIDWKISFSRRWRASFTSQCTRRETPTRRVCFSLMMLQSGSSSIHANFFFTDASRALFVSPRVRNIVSERGIIYVLNRGN